MSKSAIWPIVTIIIIVGFGLFIWGSAKNKNQTNNNPSSSSNTVANEEFFSENAKVMYFYSENCGWCKKEKEEVLSKLGKEGYKVKPIDAAVDPDIFDKYNVSGTPTFIAIDDNARLDGFQDYDTLKSFLDKYK